MRSQRNQQSAKLFDFNTKHNETKRTAEIHMAVLLEANETNKKN
jgi:hypothetical protein